MYIIIHNYFFRDRCARLQSDAGRDTLLGCHGHRVQKISKGTNLAGLTVGVVRAEQATLFITCLPIYIHAIHSEVSPQEIIERNSMYLFRRKKKEGDIKYCSYLTCHVGSP